jgi:hypothetical protein
MLDNADDSTVDYQNYFPDRLLGVIILISRNEQCKRYATKKYISLNGLSDTKACELLLSVINIPRDNYQLL